MSEESLSQIELEMAVLSRRIASVARNKREENLVRAAYLLLFQISTHGPAGVKGLAEELQLDISTVSRQAASLDQKGYIKKVPLPQDKRSYLYEITEEGRREMTEYQQIRREKVDELLSDWTEEERAQFGVLLKKFNDSVKVYWSKG
ncbi:MarR family winged helix-turn-helix transcriptional regulator [Jeotgalibacillus terrae]|uniref:MarR family winged helix-turn-helix transcriptional regulator n=1 Tax=Jeotgalibacillus terrae TaxID=587735 RepID=A0ABW5ZKM3_9BACL|nr:MarR family transcriptional regulator [Jeotgalibacillus terrae]MBM7580379.1 DNA-binding MarR family transcriptional regulator [Jeotgalibacillus terrae]